ncbi:AMP-binding protein [Rhodobacteraceae bacterium MCCB 386]|nr:AMP-binding protein [Roseitranquillus sediminis]
MRSEFRWTLPPDFNIAHACCDSWAEADPSRVALVHVGDKGVSEWTYSRLCDAASRFASALSAQGVVRGDRVAIVLGQCPEALIAHFAAMRLGAITVPLFTLFGPEALQYRLSDSGARAVVTDLASLDKLMSLDLPDVRAVFCTEPSSVRSFWDDIVKASPARAAPTTPHDPAVMIYTSGTTGPPKGALHAHRVLLGHLPAIELHHEGFGQPGDIGWTPADWAWIGGLFDMALPCLYYGVPLVSRRFRKFTPDEAWRLIADRGVRNMFLPPTALKMMRQAPVPHDVDVRSIGSGGESLGDDLRDWGREVLQAPINEFYGQTECNLVVSSSSTEYRSGCMGRAVPGHVVAVIDGAGNPVPDGEEGEIAVSTPDPVMFLRYWRQPDKTEEKFTGRWMRTGDLGRRDADGFFSFVSRDDDVITSSGYRIGPSEIEHCLAGHPDVVLAAAVGEPDPVRTEVVVAYVVLRPGASTDGLPDDLIARVRQRISPHVAPRRVVIVDSLPTTATGKIMRRELRERP